MTLKWHQRVAVSISALCAASWACAQVPAPNSVAPSAQTAKQQTAPKAEDYSKEAFIVERALTNVLFHSDGTSLQDATLRVRIQSQAGLQNYGVLHLGFAAANSKIEIAYVRVIKPDNRVVETPAENVLEMPADITRQAPFYRRKSRWR